MAETAQDIDALLAEVNALAEEAVATIASSENADASAVTTEAAPHHSASDAAFQPFGVGSDYMSASAMGMPVGSPSQMRADGTVPRSIKSGRISSSQGVRAEDLARLLRIEVPIIVQLSERTMPMSEILNLTTGSIIEFDKPADGELELKVNNKIVGVGQAVKVGENFGLRVTQIGSIHERIKAMGGQ